MKLHLLHIIGGPISEEASKIYIHRSIMGVWFASGNEKVFEISICADPDTVTIFDTSRARVTVVTKWNEEAR